MSNVITAYHDKLRDETSIYDNHAIIVDEQYEPFLITQFDLFFLSLQELTAYLKSYKAQSAFKSTKRTLSFIIIGLAIPVAGVYFSYAIKLLQMDIPDWVLIAMKELIFVAALSLIILWHDLSVNFDSHKKLPQYPQLDDFTKHSIETQGVSFQQYLIMHPLEYFHPVTFDLLINSLTTTKSNTYIDTAKLLKSLLGHDHITRVLKRLDIPNAQELFRSVSLTDESAPLYPYTALQSIILYATEQAIITRSFRVYPEHILLALFSLFPVLKEVLQQNKIEFLTFVKTIEWYIILDQYQARTNAFDISIPYYRKGGVADGWVKGFTFYLDKISFNVLDDITRKGGIYGVGHEKEINTLIGVIQKDFNANAILVGDPGVGKSSVIYGLAQRILDGDVPPTLKGLSIKSVDLNKFLALASAGQGGLPELVSRLSDELRKQVGTILYFDDLEVLLSTGVGQGTAISYLLPLLLESPVPIVGTMTFAQYTNLREKYPTLIEAFKEIRVDELKPEDTFTILTTKIQQLERYHRVTVTMPALQDIITLTQMYQPNKRFPKKAVEILEQAAAYVANTPHRILSREVVAQIIAQLTDIPAIQASPEEAEKLLTLEKRIHQKYINQHDAVLAIVDALQRAKTNIRNTSRPFGVFLFLGPSGVGKTELAKITAQEYFGSEFSIVRIDLSQYKRAEDIPAIIEQLSKVALRPYTLVLLDEFEKTIPSIHDIFMRLFDEGVVVTPKDETLYFNNTIIVATSNIGSDLLLKTSPTEFEEAKQQVLELIPQFLKIELINRFDKVVVFSPLSVEHLQQITVLMINDLVQKLQQQAINAYYSEKTVAFLVSRGYQPGMGARPLRRAMQDSLEAPLARYILTIQQQTGRNPEQVNFDELIEIPGHSTQ